MLAARTSVGICRVILVYFEDYHLFIGLSLMAQHAGFFFCDVHKDEYVRYKHFASVVEAREAFWVESRFQRGKYLKKKLKRERKRYAHCSFSCQVRWM